MKTLAYHYTIIENTGFNASHVLKTQTSLPLLKTPCDHKNTRITAFIDKGASLLVTESTSSTAQNTGITATTENTGSLNTLPGHHSGVGNGTVGKTRAVPLFLERGYLVTINHELTNLCQAGVVSSSRRLHYITI